LLAGALGSWERILLKAWMSACAFILCLCCPVYRYGLKTSKESYRLCKNDYEAEGEARAQQRALEPLMDEWWMMMNGISVHWRRILTVQISAAGHWLRHSLGNNDIL
jgi:hypothetical protein